MAKKITKDHWGEDGAGGDLTLSTILTVIRKYSMNANHGPEPGG